MLVVIKAGNITDIRFTDTIVSVIRNVTYEVT